MNIAWFVPLNEPYFGRARNYDPAVRLRRLNTHEQLLKFGITSTLYSNYRTTPVDLTAMNATIAVFSEQGEKEIEMIKTLKSKRVKIIRDHCENIFQIPYEDESFRLADKVVCCSTVLQKITNQNGYFNTIVIKDPFEKKLVTIDYDRSNLSAVYIGNSGLWLNVASMLMPILNLTGYKFIALTENDTLGIRWEMNDWHDIACSADVAIVPTDFRFPAKSNVKITTSMALGLPTIAGDLYSYREIISNGINGFFCENLEQWHQALTILKDPKERRRIGEAGKLSAQLYNIENITKQWMTLFRTLADS